MSEVVKQLVILFADGRRGTYDDAQFEAHSWGLHVIAIDQEDLIPWRQIKLVSLDN